MIPNSTVQQIRDLRSRGQPLAVIAKECQVSLNTVVKYCKGIKIGNKESPPKSVPSEQPELPPEYDGVKNLDIEQTLRENAQWAIAAAGEKHRTGRNPTECPNNSAYFMYLQAVDNPKDFFAKFSQIEGKSSEVSTFKRACQLSIKEIDEMIDEIRYLDSLPTFLRPS